MNEILYSVDDAMLLLGCFANKPNLMLSNKYKIGDNDFRCKGCDDAKFHNILYRTMYNLVANGAEEIDNVVLPLPLAPDLNVSPIIPRYISLRYGD